MPLEFVFLGAAGVMLLIFIISIAFLIRSGNTKRNQKPTQKRAPRKTPQTTTAPVAGDALSRVKEERAAMSEQKKPASTHAEDAPHPVEQRARVPQPDRAIIPPDATEVMRIWRDLADGSLIIQVGDAYYRTMGDIKAAGQDRRFLATLRELARIAKETVNQVTKPAPEMPTAEEMVSPLTEPAAAPAPQEAAEASPAPASSAELPPLSWPDSANQEEEPEIIGSFFDNVRNAIRTGGKSAKAEPAPELLSIPEQIDAILQQKIAQNPPFQNRGIKLRASHSGGIRIEVDGESYEAVSDIADDTVREFVAGAIRAWEEGN
jgi:hypothetical protein